ncbi:hypothetical protein QUC31_001391 [Theobroma cacao]
MALNGGLRSASKLLTSSSQSLLSKSGPLVLISANISQLRNSLFGRAKEVSAVACGCYKLLSSLTSILMQTNRGFHSTGVKRMGGGHAHGHDEPYYLHAKHMYNLDRMKHQKLKMSLGVFTAFSIGVGLPVYAVIFQQKKTASG